MKNRKVKRSWLALFLVIALVLSSVSVIRIGSPNAKAAGTAQIPVNLIVNGQTFRAVFYNNKTANALLKRMPMTLNMKELNGNEKYHYFDTEFPTNEKSPGKISAGELPERDIDLQAEQIHKNACPDHRYDAGLRAHSGIKKMISIPVCAHVILFTLRAHSVQPAGHGNIGLRVNSLDDVIHLGAKPFGQHIVQHILR